MHWSAVLLALVVSAVAQPIRQTAVYVPRSPQFSSVVVFGDSLVDNGNGTWQLTNHTWPSDKGYFKCVHANQWPILERGNVG